METGGAVLCRRYRGDGRHAEMLRTHPTSGQLALTRRFDAEFFTNELHHTRKYAFERLLGMETDEHALDAAFRELCKEICRIPFRLTHRDYHSRNLMVSNDEVFAIDFQDARMGPATYDLASLAFDSYVEFEDEERAYLIARYWETCGHRLFSDKEEYERALRATAIQRNLKAIGTFAYQKAVRGADRYLVSIPHTAKNGSGAFGKEEGPGPSPCFARALARRASSIKESSPFGFLENRFSHVGGALPL